MFSPLKCVLSVIIVMGTGGLFLILLTWRSDIKLNCLYKKVTLCDADKILLKDKFHQIFEEDVVRKKVDSGRNSRNTHHMDGDLHFVNKKIKYVWDASTQVSP